MKLPTRLLPVAPPGGCSWRRGATVLLAGLLLASCQKKEIKMAEEPKPDASVQGNVVTLSTDSPKQASLATATAQPLNKSSLTVNGRLTWDEATTVPVYTPIAGRVSTIDVKLGDQVGKDQTLATIFSPDFGQAQADAGKADADFKLSKRTLERLRDLLKHGAAAQKDVEAAEDDFDSKQAELQRATARLELYGGKLGLINGMYPLQAPIGGTVVDKHVNPGQEIRPDTVLASIEKYTSPLFIVSDPSRLSVLLDVTELDLQQFKPGQQLTVHSRAYPNQVFHGELEVIGGALDPQTRTIYARGFVDNADNLLKAEMYVAVDVQVDFEHAAPSVADHNSTSPAPQELTHKQNQPVEIPVKAVFSKESQHFVFLEQGPGKYERRSIQIGRERDGHIAVLAGLTSGQKVVTDGCLLLESIASGGGSKD